ncbi:MAG: 3-deoxy-manno-octulosonate cytidylyltransferase [Planctomycetes bacterium]|nr:3-deoxy-manno-octulosonate cytidylyltransferase [Planctomycetota bacterium]
MKIPVTIAVIPARYAARRLPGKPLLRKTGKYLVQHVYERVILAKRVSRVLIATDDARVVRAAESFGAETVLTSRRHPNGTSRCWEAVRSISCERIINVQGDEPEVDPRTIDLVEKLLDEAEMTTAATAFASEAEADLPQRVKVVLNRDGFALYFSRSRIPFSGPPRLHVGIYGYRRRCLSRLVRLRPTPLAEQELLEQLRALEHGIGIRVGLLRWPCAGGIDTTEDYEAFVRRWEGNG